jgi:hypothetical protein
MVKIVDTAKWHIFGEIIDYNPDPEPVPVDYFKEDEEVIIEEKEVKEEKSSGPNSMEKLILFVFTALFIMLLAMVLKKSFNF